jgi:uncharacterized protein DUF5681
VQQSKWRGKRKGTTVVEALNRVLYTPVEYRQGGKSKRAPRIEVAINRIGTTALEGDVGAADMLLDLREHFEKHTDFKFITKILITTKLV